MQHHGVVRKNDANYGLGLILNLILVGVLIAAGFLLYHDAKTPEDPAKMSAAKRLPPCAGIDHRTNAPPAMADENTIVGQRWDAAHGVMSEIDMVATLNGGAAYHYKLWEQGTRNGVGAPSTTTSAYVKTLVTKDRGQGVPTAGEMLLSIKRTHGKALIELHYTWTRERIQGLVNQIRSMHMQKQIWLTGTKDRLSILKTMVGPLFKVVFRIKVGKPADDHLLQKYGADIVQVRGNELPARVSYYRSHGYPVWGSGPRSAWSGLKALGVRRVQTDLPVGWIRYCKAR